MPESLDRLISDPTVVRLATALLGVLLVVLAVRLVKRSALRRIRDGDTRYRARKMVTGVGYLLAVLVLVVVYSPKLGGLTVAFGVAGAGIAFALQELIASVAGWFALTFSGFYKTGDRVQLGGIKGDVIDIGVLRTTLMEVGEWVKGDLYTGRVVRVANSFIFKEPVFNYSGDFPFLWDEIILPIKYGSDHREARALITRVATEELGSYAEGARIAWKELVERFLVEDASVEPLVTMVANDNWIEFTLRYVVDYKARRGTRDRLFARLLDAIDDTDGRVAMASATFHLVETPVIDVRLRDAREAR